MTRPGPPAVAELARAGVTAREAELLAAVAERLSNREIADRFHISTRTVESHVSALLRKLAISDRLGLVRLGAQISRNAASPLAEMPEPATTFVGRRRELAGLAEALGRTKLLTLVGPGGVGKTRLAVRFAAINAPAFPDGARLADFTSVSSGQRVAEAMGRALGLAEQPHQGFEHTLRQRTANMACLLVLDNCEHVIEDVAACVADFLSVGGPSVLATSREPLGVPGETVYPIAPLTLPDDCSSAQLAASEAGRLFLDRAASACPDFMLTEDNAPAVADICRRLDGLPLALELAAVRVRALSTRHLAAHLDQRFDLLTAGARTGSARHRSLEAAVAWSYETLDDSERALFGRLSVFRGTFDYDAVESICAEPPLDRSTIVGAFPRLLDTSLVAAQHDEGDGMRYRLLESLRAYGDERLDEAARRKLRDRHAAHYLALAEAAAPHLKGPDQTTWLHRLGKERSNIDLALSWCVETADSATAWRLVSVLGLHWDDTGHRHAARDAVNRVLAIGLPSATSVSVHGLAAASFLLHRADVEEAHRLACMAAGIATGLGLPEQAKAALSLGWSLAYLGRREDAIETLQRSVTLLGNDGDPWDRATALQGLALATAELDLALDHAARSVELFRRTGDRRRVANALYTMADGALNAGARLDDVGMWLKESLALSEAVGSEHDRVHALLGLARLAWQGGQVGKADSLLDECLPALRRLGDQRCTGRALQLLGESAMRKGDRTRAVALLRESLRAAAPAGDHGTVTRARHTLAEVAAASHDV